MTPTGERRWCVLQKSMRSHPILAFPIAKLCCVLFLQNVTSTTGDFLDIHLTQCWKYLFVHLKTTVVVTGCNPCSKSPRNPDPTPIWPEEDSRGKSPPTQPLWKSHIAHCSLSPLSGQSLQLQTRGGRAPKLCDSHIVH